jgi:hypothetical protein
MRGRDAGRRHSESCPSHGWMTPTLWYAQREGVENSVRAGDVVADTLGVTMAGINDPRLRARPRPPHLHPLRHRLP